MFGKKKADTAAPPGCLGRGVIDATADRVAPAPVSVRRLAGYEPR